MYSSAACLLDIADALRELMTLCPINLCTATLLCRVLDGLADYSALLSHEMSFRLYPRAALRVVTNDNPKPSRRRPPVLRLVT